MQNNSDEAKRIRILCSALHELTESQLLTIEKIVDQFSRPFTLQYGLNTSDLIDSCVLGDFGDALRIHHCFSKEPFSKDKFEYALEATLKLCGRSALLAARGNPGHDITIDGQKCSLKTQADRNISENRLHISKFMELGRGKWTDSVDDLVGLREQFIEHLKVYDRIFSLRCLSKYPRNWRYELVEIPKLLLLESIHGQLRIITNTTQLPKPGYCDVYNDSGTIKFQLYFDGGTERKLQIRNLLKDYCTVHAIWEFVIKQPWPEMLTEE